MVFGKHYNVVNDNILHNCAFDYDIFYYLCRKNILS